MAEDEFISGLNVSRLGELPPEEKDRHLTWLWRNRGPLYPVWDGSLMADYAPEFLKLHYRGVRYADQGDPSGVEGPQDWSHADHVVWSCQNLPTYIYLGWETGILNEFNALRKLGVTKEQTMELVMFAQLYAGMRGLGHVFRAVGETLPAWGAPDEPAAVFPAGWAVDAAAFRAGLDLSTRRFTEADRANLTGWYDRTIGYVPESIRFGLKFHPEFVKVNRAKWEASIRTLPKQLAPILMLRHNAVTQSEDGLREAALLAKAWGVQRRYVLQTLVGVAFYFAGFEGFYAPARAIEDILDDMA